MKSTQTMIGVLSCTLLLGLGLSPLARADTPTETADELKAEQSDRRQGGQEAGEQQMSGMKKEAQSQEGKTVKGKVLRIEGGNWFLKEENGKEIQVHVDQTTQQYPKKIDGKNMKGVQIEAMVNDQNHALSIRSSDRRDDRHDHSSKATSKKAK
jgi:predicted RNA-binding protein with RPS1 domain